MFDKLKYIFLVPAILLVGFTFMPTGTSTADIVAGYNTTNSYSASGATYLNYLSAAPVTSSSTEDTPYLSTLREKVCKEATELCTTYGYGEGGDTWEVDTPGAQGRISRTSEQATSYAMVQEQMKSDGQIGMQCAGFASYCWVAAIAINAPMDINVAGLIDTWGVYDELKGIDDAIVWEVVKSGETKTPTSECKEAAYDFVINNAEPGDLLFYVDNDYYLPDDAYKGKYEILQFPPLQVSVGGKVFYYEKGHTSPWAHVEVYLGEGKIAGSNTTDPVWKQAYIKDFTAWAKPYILSMSDAAKIVAGLGFANP